MIPLLHGRITYSSIKDSWSALQMDSFIVDRCYPLCDSAAAHRSIWYIEVFDEAAAKQLSAMLDDSSSIDDYFPSLYTQDTMMTQMLPDGVFSWIKYKADSIFIADSAYCPTVSTNYSMMHTIGDDVWAGFNGISIGSDITQANCVRAYFEMQYLQYDPEYPPGDTISNTPDRLSADAYPIRLAGYHWQTVTEDSITVLGSATDLWMLDHYEELLDSTFIPAGTLSGGPYTVNYVPQSFGRTGGEAIWEIAGEPSDTTINYNPYAYRIPSPAEFRMLCNIGLLRGAKGIFPFCITSYDSWKGDTLKAHNAGLLDVNLIPFDDPYENWVYRDRNPSDYWYAPPDSIPPWTAADGNDFDPLYTVPDRPDTITGDQQTTQDYLEWKFAAYGRLWNSTRGTFREIARVAPELSGLWWWFSGDRYDNATIVYNSQTLPLHFADPHVRVFTDSTESTCYLYYVNRFCRANDNPFKIRVNAATFPSPVDFSEYALDHSRRCLVEGDSTGLVFYEFLDTLDAGEARLLQMIDGTSIQQADIRITDPDIFMIRPQDNDTLTDNRGLPGDSVVIHARFYNMGMGSVSNLFVYLKDETENVMLDTTRVSFDGLDTDSCYKCDVDEAVFGWRPDSTQIGVHVLSVYTGSVSNEPDTEDNSATLVYFVEPRDYATEVLDDPWDMTEASTQSIPPPWKTFDIDTLTGGWSSYTDSISGMFEGRLSTPTNSNGLYLNTGTGRDDWIDADLYRNFSIAGYSEFQTDITVHWTDSGDDSYSVATGEVLKGTAADVGPVDLYDLSNGDWSGMIKKIWLEFSGTNLTTDIRIGWVRLTE